MKAFPFTVVSPSESPGRTTSFFLPVPFLYYIYATAGVRLCGQPNKNSNKFSPTGALCGPTRTSPTKKEPPLSWQPLAASDIQCSVIAPVDRIGNC